MYTITFGSYTFPNQTFEIASYGDVQNDISEDVVIQKHGTVIQTPFLRSRRIRVKGLIHEETTSQARTMLDDMLINLNNGEQNLQVDNDRVIKSYLRSVSADNVKGSDKSILEVDIDFIAQNPFFLSGSSYTVISTHTAGTNTFEVYNGGKVYSEAKVSIYANGTTLSDSVNITNMSNLSQNFRFRGDVIDGKTLCIDAENYEVKNNGIDALTYFEGYFLDLVAGTNTIQVVGGTQIVTLEYKYRWL